jgi:hypothetical protein
VQSSETAADDTEARRKEARDKQEALRAESLKRRDERRDARAKEREAAFAAENAQREKDGLDPLPEPDPANLAALDVVAGWDWAIEPHDWSSVPTWYTPDAYSPVAAAPRSPDDTGAIVNLLHPDENWNMTTKLVRAVPAIEVMQMAGYTADPADLPQPPAGTTSSGAFSAMSQNRATGVRSGP